MVPRGSVLLVTHLTSGLKGGHGAATLWTSASNYGTGSKPHTVPRHTHWFFEPVLGNDTHQSQAHALGQSRSYGLVAPNSTTQKSQVLLQGGELHAHTHSFPEDAMPGLSNHSGEEGWEQLRMLQYDERAAGDQTAGQAGLLQGLDASAPSFTFTGGQGSKGSFFLFLLSNRPIWK